MFSATLFDFNGVLVDDELVHLAAFRDAVAPLGITISDRDYFEEYLGFDDKGAFRALLAKHGLEVTDARVAELVRTKEPLYLERARASLQTFQGASELVRRRAAAGPVAVVSGALRPEIELGLEVLGVRALVGHIVSSEDTPVSKPDPEGYRMGIAWLRTAGAKEPGRALVIEDSVDGIAAAKAAGLPCVAVTHSYEAPRLVSAGADLVVGRLGELDESALGKLYTRIYG